MSHLRYLKVTDRQIPETIGVTHTTLLSRLKSATDAKNNMEARTLDVRVARKSPLLVLAAFAFSASILWLGYVSFGFWTATMFSSSFLGGFFLWLAVPGRPPFSQFRAPYFAALLLFLLHRIEERISGFFEALVDITGVATPALLSWSVILLVASSVGGWLFVPFLVRKGYEFGYYLAWTFFTAMGLTELTHFVFPFLTGQPYGYFPGMGSVLLLAPVAWWGMYRLARYRRTSLVQPSLTTS